MIEMVVMLYCKIQVPHMKECSKFDHLYYCKREGGNEILYADISEQKAIEQCKKFGKLKATDGRSK